MIHPRIKRLSELVTTVAGNVKIKRRIYGTDPMEIDGRRPRPFRRSLGTSRYSNVYQSEKYDEGNNKGSITTTRPRKCFVCKRVGYIKKDCPTLKEKIKNRPKLFTVMSNRRTVGKVNVLLKVNRGIQMPALIDSGSDLNFLDYSTMERYRIQIQKLYKDKFVVGLGGKG